MTAVAGSSTYVRGGVIAYADDVKAEQLGVGRHLLAIHGAVSPEVAGAMASEVRRRFTAALGVGITGVAGPDASERKPPGLVFVAVADPATVRVIRLDEDNGRELNRAHAVQAAIRLCVEVIHAASGSATGSLGGGVTAVTCARRQPRLRACHVPLKVVQYKCSPHPVSPDASPVATPLRHPSRVSNQSHHILGVQL